MTQYNLRSLPARDYEAMNAGEDLDENEVFHDSFDFPPAIVPPGTSHGNSVSQSSTPLASNRGANGQKDEITELSVAVAQAKAENERLERRAGVAKLKAELHALRKPNALLQSKTARDEAFPAECTGAQEPSVTIKELRADPALTARVSAEVDGLGLSSSDSEDDGGTSNKKSSRASLQTICLYCQFLSRSMTPPSVRNYLSGVKLLHFMLGFEFPDLSAHEFKITLRGIERLAQHRPHRAPPITPDFLSTLVSCGVDFDTSDITFSCAFLFTFFLFAHISNLVPESSQVSHAPEDKRICRGHVVPTHYGLCVKFTWSKTVQFGQRVLELPLVRVPHSPLCPVRMFYLMCELVPAPDSATLFVLPSRSGRLRPVLKSQFVLVMRQPLQSAGVPRRGGTSWAFSSGLPGEIIQVLGDWRSDACKCYLDISMPLKLRVSEEIGIALIGVECTNQTLQRYLAPKSSNPECKDLSWHSLPLNNKPLLTQWIVKLRHQNTPLTKNSFLCSQHFEECFTKALGGSNRYLKPGSVPTKLVFTVEKAKRCKPSYSQVANVSPNFFNSSTSDSQTICAITHGTQHTIDIKTENNTSNDVESEEMEDNNLEIHENNCADKATCQTKERDLLARIKELERQLEEERSVRKELELLMKKKEFSIESVKENDKLIRFYTGFENDEMFSSALDFLGREAASMLDYHNTEDLKDLKSRYKSGPSRVLSIENEFFMVLCRLKAGLLEEDLTTRFGVSQSVVSQIVTTWIKFMYFRFKELDIFPSKDIMKIHMPECFLKKYSSTTLLLDATEIYIEKPRNPEAQQLTFSSYKNTNTLKALVGIVPKGGISFVSTLYGGSISDKEITQLSGLIDKLERGDVITADRGFNIKDILKVGLLEEDLTTRFGVSQSVVSQIVTTWIKFMYFRFKELDIFPSKDIVKIHMPECFLKKYSSTTLLLDATEIYIEKPRNPEAQQLTFSSYKNTNTLKALVGIVPKGGISFVSTLYGGSISDKEITQLSGLIDKLERGDVITADRGFNIKDMLASKGVRVNLSPFMNQSGQFTENELLETRRIASLRIHVERAIERIKNYHILDFVPITLCRNGVIEMIFFVCAMLSNYLPPLVDG
ncbi:THAP domain-containing protein 4 [Stylophora pistillata]|uniref:THAP domain-containing protein 4 n=1 Tax=Stylophora pistillata TaxID=50429 RepID=A0A2B4RA37_STYPI|nr:THAP domain-containing protein 4 [Stylophora pistillata]